MTSPEHEFQRMAPPPHMEGPINEYGYAGPVSEHEQVVLYDPRITGALGSMALEKAAGAAVEPHTATEALDGEIVDAEVVRDSTALQVSDARKEVGRARQPGNGDDQDTQDFDPRRFHREDTREQQGPEKREKMSKWLGKAYRIQMRHQKMLDSFREHGQELEWSDRQRIGASSEEFITALLMPEAQRQAGGFPLTEAGFELISAGLRPKDGGPSIRELAGLKKFVDSQWENSGELERARSSRPGETKYKTRFGFEIGPFEDGQENPVAETYKKLDPDYWRLKPEDREFYEKVAGMTTMLSSPSSYNPQPFVFGNKGEHNPYAFAARKVRGAVQGRRARKHDEKIASEPPVAADDIALSERIIRRYQRKGPDEPIGGMSGGNVTKEAILKLARRDALARLRRDDQLAFLKAEQETADEHSEASIAEGVKSMSHMMAPDATTFTPKAEIPSQLAFYEYEWEKARIHREAAEERLSRLEGLSDEEAEELSRDIRERKTRSLDEARRKYDAKK